MFLDFGIYSCTGIGNGEPDIVPGQNAHVSFGIRFINRKIGYPDRQLTAMRHGVPCVDHKVHQHLFNLSGIGFHQTQIAIKQGGHFNVLPDHPPQHFLKISDHDIKMQGGGLQHLLTAERQELSDQVGCPTGGFMNLAKLGQQRTGARLLKPHQIGNPHYHRKDIVEVMGDPTR